MSTTPSTKQHTPHSNTPEKHQFGAETSKILQLMIHSLYAHKDIFLRELISNASDACDKLRYNALTHSGLLEENPDLTISIIADSSTQTLTITDTGIGMNKKDLINHLGTIASSGTQRFMEAQASKENLQLIGQFGVGFYSAFMVANTIRVISAKAGQKKTWEWFSAGDGTYEIHESETSHPRGTSVILHLKDDQKEFLDKHRIKHIVKTYSDHIDFSISLTDTEGHTEIINQGVALWTRAKNTITEAQYHEFYKHIAHAPDTPWMYFHHKAEGTLEYTSLLFIPSRPPFDLFHPDRLTRVKLYVKRVFIAEEHIDIIPKYLRFIKGIVDSEDLPLNISRETLQHNSTIQKIRNNIVKRILNELKKKAAEDSTAFETFWQHFGSTLKEGLCEAVDTNRELLLEVCHFKNSLHPGKLMTLDQYIQEMPEKQTRIYYAIGDSPEALAESPQLEGFIKKGINVLLLTDHVDDFWVNTMHEYKDKEFISVTRSGLDIENVGTNNPEENEKEHEISQPDLDKVVNFMKQTLKGKVLNVALSKKLTHSPVCLSVQEGGMDMRMERFLLDQKQLASPSLKILEINPDHPIIAYLAAHLQDTYATDLAELLFDQACIIEGEAIYDTPAFTKRFNSFLEKALAS